MNFAAKIRTFKLAATAVVLAGATAAGSAQQATSPELTQQAMLNEAGAGLPDAPSALLPSSESSSSEAVSGYVFQTPGTVSNGQIVPPGKQIVPAHAITIPAGWQAPPLTPKGKFAVSLVESYSWESIAGYLVAAGYSQITDGQPNYGANVDGRPNNESTGEVFGKRLGAAALRGTTENILADGMLASAFHEDPRYYIEGDGHSFFNRLWYSGTRPLWTQSDSGHKRVNASLLLGYLLASAITPAYYPKINRDAKDVARTYGSSLGGAAVGFVFDEFVGDAVNMFHHRHDQP